MTTRARAAVRSTRTKLYGWAWAAAIESDDETLACEAGYAPTMLDAVTASHEALESMQRQLMDEVHASRAARRETHTPDIHTMEPTA